MNGWRALGVGGVGLALSLVAAPAARAGDSASSNPAVQDVLDILKGRGIVDDGQHAELTAKNQAYEAKHAALLGRIEFTGDFRFRYEGFWYERDELGAAQSNRERLRYRLRLQGKAAVNEYVDAVLRLASGENDHRSTNRSAGFDDDFGPDAIFIDQAYLAFKAPRDWFEGATLTATTGKVPNPFLWKQSRIDLLWDADINPEGIAGQALFKPQERLSVFANAGYFIIDENGTSVDPHVFGIQGGLSYAASPTVELGARASYYAWGSLNPAFFGRSAGSGSILDGLTDDAPGVSADSLSAYELAAYVRLSSVPGWPVLVYGHFAQNLDAHDTALFPGAGDEDTGFGLGVEVGDKKKLVAIGAGYYFMEANFWPAQYTDSDVFDGFTNRKGWAFWVVREILPNTELGMELFLSDELQSNLPAFTTSVRNADRVRFRTDIQVKF
jgi:hypothetical protein